MSTENINEKFIYPARKNIPVWDAEKPDQAFMPKTVLQGWNIEKNPKPIPDRRHDYDFWHDDVDIDNRLCGTAESVEDAMRQIAEIEGELEGEIEKVAS